ncbi:MULTISPECIES: hypothetical protein [Mesorhizobium]|uniref:hypothetical protein n=1 Tax=Mesorhizobium TaxID=68287 RepID=UPI001314D237|nr:MULTISPECIES: hypothetical protein [Mesorhizobium]
MPADELESVVEAALIQILHNRLQLTEMTRGLILTSQISDAIDPALVTLREYS